jgi:hypothetical protein
MKLLRKNGITLTEKSTEILASKKGTIDRVDHAQLVAK